MPNLLLLQNEIEQKREAYNQLQQEYQKLEKKYYALLDEYTNFRGDNEDTEEIPVIEDNREESEEEYWDRIEREWKTVDEYTEEYANKIADEENKDVRYWDVNKNELVTQYYQDKRKYR
jgi:hypothetical protein